MTVQQHRLGVTVGRNAPQRLHSAGAHLFIADALGFFGRQMHRLDDVSLRRQVQVGVGEPRAQRVQEVRELFCLCACHQAAFHQDYWVTIVM